MSPINLAAMATHPIIAEDKEQLRHRTRLPCRDCAPLVWVLLTALATLWFAHPQALHAAEAAPSPPATTFIRPTRQIDVNTFGAEGDDDVDDAAAFQAALSVDDVVVYVPKGKYIISRPLRVPSSRWITAAEGAVICLADDAGKQWDSFLVTNMNPERGDHDVVIEGGVWDGNNLRNPRKREYHGRSYGGVLINFTNIRRLTLRRLTIRNPESFSIRLGQAEDFVVEDITFDQSQRRPNQDGIHVGGFSHRGLIQRLRVSSATGTHDDMVALNADDDVERPFNVGMRCGPITDICVSDLRAADAYTFVRLLSHINRISNVCIENINGGFRTNVINADRWRFPPGGGELYRITIRNLRVTHVGEKADPCVTIQSCVDDFRLVDLQRPDQGVALNPVPTLVLDNARHNRVAQQLTPGGPNAPALNAAVYAGKYQVECGNIASMTISSTQSP